DRSAAAGRDDLIAVEAQNAGRAKRTAMAAVIEASHCFGRILDQGHVTRHAQRPKSVDSGRMAKQVDGHHRGDASAARAMAQFSTLASAFGREEPLQIGDVETKIPGVDVEKQRRRAAMGDAVRGCDEADGRTNDEIAGADTESMERGMQSHGAVGGRNRKCSATVTRELFFETVDI